MSTPKPYRTNLNDVPLVQGLNKDDGWVDMQVQFLIDQKTAGADSSVVGWAVLKPGAAHERHLHRNCDEFFIVLKGSGHLYVEDHEEPAKEGGVVYSPRGVHTALRTHRTKTWCWSGAGTDRARWKPAATRLFQAAIED